MNKKPFGLLPENQKPILLAHCGDLGLNEVRTAVSSITKKLYQFFKVEKRGNKLIDLTKENQIDKDFMIYMCEKIFGLKMTMM